MNTAGIHHWLKTIWSTDHWTLLRSNSLLLIDFSCHIDEKVMRWLQAKNTNAVIIPSELTSIFQQLDVCLNKPFKQGVKSRWSERMLTTGANTFTASGAQRRPTISLVWCASGSRKHGMKCDWRSCRGGSRGEVLGGTGTTPLPPLPQYLAYFD